MGCQTPAQEIHAAHVAYERAEAEAWAQYAEDPCRRTARDYLTLEEAARRACAERIVRARYRRGVK